MSVVFQQQVFDEYMQTDMPEWQLIAHLDRLQSKNAKTNGVVYTPWNVVAEMMRLADPSPNHYIVEPSCGHGVFLIGLLYDMHRKMNCIDQLISEKDCFDVQLFNHSLLSTELLQANGQRLLNWFLNHATAFELSHQTVLDTQLILQAFFKKRFNLEVSPDIFSNIVCTDSLKVGEDVLRGLSSKTHFEQSKGLSAGSLFDVCIGNPPYVRAKHLSNDYLAFLKSNFVSCKKGTTDIYFAFIERFTQWATTTVLITPNSFLSSKAGEILKAKIAPHIHTLIDFKDKKVFQDANVYTCVFKTVQISDNSKTDSIGAGSHHKHNTVLYGQSFADLKRISASDLFLGSTVLQSNNSLVQENNESTSNTVTVLSGIATLCDKVFSVKKDTSGDFSATLDGKEYPIEKGAVAAYLKLTKIHSNDDLKHIGFMIYPYTNKQIIPEHVFKVKFPKAYAYLLATKEMLLKRDKGKTSKYEAWYAYGRKQGLHEFKESGVVSVPQMIGGSCVVCHLDLSTLQKEFKNIVFTSGYLLPNNDKNRNLLLTLFQQEFSEFVQKNGRIWPGRTAPYYSVTSKQIGFFLQNK